MRTPAATRVVLARCSGYDHELISGSEASQSHRSVKLDRASDEIDVDAMIWSHGGAMDGQASRVRRRTWSYLVRTSTLPLRSAPAAPERDVESVRIMRKVPHLVD
jgi:hypothetical protein